MKTPYDTQWIALDALGPEDEDAELRAFVSVDLEERDEDIDEQALRRWQALAQPASADHTRCE